jgi:hypothetical protein
MDFTLVFYIIVSIMLVTGTFYFNYKAGRSIQAIIIGGGLILISVFFGLRWFMTNSTAALQKIAPAWPPSINTCPDFLSLMRIDKTHVCVDPLGVSMGGMEKWTSPTQTDAKYLFNLSLGLSAADRSAALCEECKTKKVTWEGVWNGSVCSGVVPPLPT